MAPPIRVDLEGRGHPVWRLLRLRLHFRALKLIGNLCRDGEALSAVQPVPFCVHNRMGFRDPFQSELKVP